MGSFFRLPARKGDFLKIVLPCTWEHDFRGPRGSKKHQNRVRKQCAAGNVLRERLGELRGSILERFSLHFGPPNRSKSESKRKLNCRSNFEAKNKTWLSWNGKRERQGSVEHCRPKKRRKSIGKEERPEHEHREEQQGKRSESIGSRNPARLYNRGGALARALRARAAGWSGGDHILSV